MIEPIPPIPLLVLDTNVVLDWVAFDDARVRPITAAIERGVLRTASSGACLEELRRALGYAQVKLDCAAQALAFARYAAHTTVFEVPEPRQRLLCPGAKIRTTRNFSSSPGMRARAIC